MRESYLLDFVGKLLRRFTILSGNWWEPTEIKGDVKNLIFKVRTQSMSILTVETFILKLSHAAAGDPALLVLSW